MWVLDERNSATNLYYREVIDGKMSEDEAMSLIKRDINR